LHSILDSLNGVLEASGIQDSRWLQVVDAREAVLLGRENALGEVPGYARRLPWRAPLPTVPLLLWGVADAEIATDVGHWLCNFYPVDHTVLLVNGESRTALQLTDLEAADQWCIDTAVLVPPLSEEENVRTFSGIMNLTRTLRAPDGCPWDREQTHATLRPHLLEEAYEVLDALDSGEPALVAEEMGDLLYQITIHSQVAAEAGEFTVEDVFENITRKLIGRHPHVFGELELGSAHEVRQAWETFKQRQKPSRTSVLEDIPHGLPALPQSNLMQKRAASVGFDWAGISDVLAKITEEIGELSREINDGRRNDQLQEELGDVLFATVTLARHLKIDPEVALRLANRKFAERFRSVESRVAAEGKSMRSMSDADLLRYWSESKLD
jgi:tetrapyrrole methylase family protein/MazG family protein